MPSLHSNTKLLSSLNRIQFFKAADTDKIPNAPLARLAAVTRYVANQYSVPHSQISQGYCYFWAFLAHQLLPGSTLQYNTTHVWVEYKGHAYDSSNYCSIIKPLSAPRPPICFKERDQISSPATPVSQVINYWLLNGKFNNSFFKLLKAFKFPTPFRSLDQTQINDVSFTNHRTPALYPTHPFLQA